MPRVASKKDLPKTPVGKAQIPILFCKTFFAPAGYQSERLFSVDEDPEEIRVFRHQIRRIYRKLKKQFGKTIPRVARTSTWHPTKRPWLVHEQLATTASTCAPAEPRVEVQVYRRTLVAGKPIP